MILLFTDFGVDGPYTGQMIASLRHGGFTGEVISLFADAPTFSPKYSGRLLARYQQEFPAESVFLTVIDPGVGSARKPLIVNCQDKWFVGPDNGVFEYLYRQDAACRVFEVTWRPDRLSSSFHGRDLFAPIAAEIATQGLGPGKTQPLALDQVRRYFWPDQMAEVIYVDVYGNCMTGIEAAPKSRNLSVGGRSIPFCETFSDVGVGEPLCYLNSNGLLEISVNQGSAAALLNLSVGSPVQFGEL